MADDFDDPVMFGPQQLVTSSKLSKSLGSYLDKAQKRPIFVQRENEVEAVLININDYRDLLLEEQKVEDLYLAVKSLRRLVENTKAGTPLIELDDVLKRYGLSKESLAEVPDNYEKVDD